MIDVTVPFEMPQMLATKYLLTAKYTRSMHGKISHTASGAAGELC